MKKTEKLFKLLKLVNGVKSTQWNTVIQLVDWISKGNVIIKEKKWNAKWEQNLKDYPLDLSKIDTWSTYDTCFDLQFTNKTSKNKGSQNNFLVCKVKIYEGEPFQGSRTDLRFEAILWLPISFINNLEKLIEWEFNAYLEDAYKNYLDAKKRLWIHNMKSDILKH